MSESKGRKDHHTSGPMAGYGFTENELDRYNYTDEELREFVRAGENASAIGQLKFTRDQLIYFKKENRKHKRIFGAIFILAAVILLWWRFG